MKKMTYGEALHVKKTRERRGREQTNNDTEYHPQLIDFIEFFYFDRVDRDRNRIILRPSDDELYGVLN